MSDTQQLQLLDFTSPRKPRQRHWKALSKWHESMCVLTTEAWAALLVGDLKLAPGSIQPRQFRNAVTSFPADAVGVQFEIAAERMTSVLVFSRRQLHGLLADMLNVEGEEWPVARDFTRAEKSMLAVLYQALGGCVGDGIPGSEPTACHLIDTFSKPQRTRLYAQDDEVFVCEIVISSRFGEEPAYWLCPKSQTEQLLGEEAQEVEISERDVNPTLESLAERISVDVVVELGQCDVSMAQVGDLSIGDVLVLDQPISRPLPAYVAGERKWLGQPLRIGPRQGFEVVELVAE